MNEFERMFRWKSLQSSVNLYRYNLVLLKKKYQRSFSEILNVTALLGEKFIFIPLGIVFSFKHLESLFK